MPERKQDRASIALPKGLRLPYRFLSLIAILRLPSPKPSRVRLRFTIARSMYHPFLNHYTHEIIIFELFSITVTVSLVF